MDAAVLAKGVLCGPGVELVGRQLVLAAEKLESLRRHDQMQKSFLRADRAVAIGHAREIGRDAKPHASAMASAFHRLEHGHPAQSCVPSPNNPNCAGSRAGSANPRWRKACEVKSRPRGVRWRKPFWIRNGSMISSMASRGSESAAAIVSTPTGPPP